MNTHPYDNPDLNPWQFLRAVMHDQSQSIANRMEAAKYLLNMPPEPRTIKVIISGGLPSDDDWADTCATIEDCRRRTTPCPWQRHMGHLCHELLQVQGHA